MVRCDEGVTLFLGIIDGDFEFGRGSEGSGLFTICGILGF